MSYTPDNNPYIPGDPYSYDLKWIVAQIKRLQNAITGIDDETLDYTAPEVFGAVGDGIHDDTAAIQEALDSGKSCVVLTGSYLVNNNKNATNVTDGTDSSRTALIIDHPVKIIGRPGSKIIGSNDNNPSLDIKYVFAVNAEGVEFDGLTIDNQWPTFNRHYGIQANSSYLTIKNCKFYNHGSSALVINGTYGLPLHDIRVDDITCENMGNTIFAAWADDCTFNNFNFRNVSEGFDFDKRCRRIAISNGNIDTKRGGGSGDAGIEFNGAEHCSVTNVNISNFIDGIMLNAKITPLENVDTRCRYITISNVNMYNIDGYGVVCGNNIAGEPDIYDLTISNIVVDTSTLHSLHLRGSNVVVQGAVLKNSAYGAILIDSAGSTENVTLANIQSYANAQGFIDCAIDVGLLNISNCVDDESANASTVNNLTGLTKLIISGLTVINADSLASLSGRVYNIDAAEAYVSQLTVKNLANAFIGFSDDTVRYISNSNYNISAAQEWDAVNILRVETNVPSTGRIYNTGDIIVCSNSDVYICITGNVGGGTPVFKQFTIV